MNKTVITLLFLFLFSLPALRGQQDTDTLISSDSIIQKGLELHDNGKYQDAVNEYARVSICDPNYPRSCYEMALSYYYLDEKNEALKKLREAQFLQWDDPALYSRIGNILDDIDSSGAGIVVLKRALKKWPYNQNLLYNLSLCYLKSNRPDLAEPLLIRSIHYNPYHASSHMALAKANYMMGRLGQSYLAFNMAILLNPGFSYIQNFENAVTGTADISSNPLDFPYPAGTDHKKWDRLNWFMQSELAFNNKFDYPHNANYLVCRESLLLFREMKFDRTDTSIYNQLYVRIFSDVMNKGYFETLENYQFKNLNNEDIDNWIKKNSSKYNSFINWAQTTISNRRNYGFSILNEQNKITFYHFNEQGDLESTGEQSDDDAKIKNGWWTVINNDGSVTQHGKYVDDKLEGKWNIYYPDGTINQIVIYRNNKIDSTIRSYFPNGALRALYPYQDDKESGIEKYYSPTGQLISWYTYCNDTLCGPGRYINYTKGFSKDFSYSDDSLDGPYTETWLTGTPKTKCTYKMGKYDGAYQTWYKNGKPKFKGYYNNGVQTGKSINYYPNGRESSEAELDSTGKLVNKYVSWFRDGTLSSEESTYKAGKLNGMVRDYYESGEKSDEMVYENDKPVKLTCYDTKGEVIYQTTSKDSNIMFRSYFPDGTLRTEGSLYKGERRGNWRIYDRLGRLVKNLDYLDDLIWGPVKTYYANGAIREEYGCDSNYIYGPYTEYYKSGAVKSKGNYDMDGQTGEWFTYYSNDSLQVRQFFAKGHTVGRSINYSPEGNMTGQLFFNPDGKAIRSIDYNETGKPDIDVSYKYGSALIKEFFANGKLKYIGLIRDNEQDSLLEYYFPNGQLKYKADYLHGNINGFSRKWDYLGNRVLNMPYILGTPEGKAEWFEDGKPDFTSNFINGITQDSVISYDYDGKIYRISHYKDDEKHGYSYYFAPDGTLMYRLNYYEGVLTGYSYKKPDGSFIADRPVDTTTTEITCYYPDGTRSVHFNLNHGELNGPYVSYYRSGKTMFEANYKDGENDGHYIWYYQNGRPRLKADFHNDVRQGKFIAYYENGKKKREGQFNSGKHEGEWYIYDKTGKLTETHYYYNDEMYDIRRN